MRPWERFPACRASPLRTSFRSAATSTCTAWSDADNPPANLEQVPFGDRYTVSADYLSTMRIPIIKGSAFTAAETTERSNKVALVSEALATRLWPNENPLGKRIRVGGGDGPARTVIGVTGNIRHSGLDAKTTLQWYVPERQFDADNQEVLIVRTVGDPAALAPAVRRTIAADRSHATDREDRDDGGCGCRLHEPAPARARAVRHLCGGGAAARHRRAFMACWRAASPSARARSACAARSARRRGKLIGLIVGQGGRLAALGIVLGLVGSFALTRYLQSLLFGVAPNDLATLAGVCLLLAAVTLAACLVPAARAARVDPSTALRSE